MKDARLEKEDEFNRNLLRAGHLASFSGVISFGLSIKATLGADFMFAFWTLLLALSAFAPDMVQADAWMEKRGWERLTRGLVIISVPVVLVIILLGIAFSVGASTGRWIF